MTEEHKTFKKLFEQNSRERENRKWAKNADLFYAVLLQNSGTLNLSKNFHISRTFSPVKKHLISREDYYFWRLIFKGQRLYLLSISKIYKCFNIKGLRHQFPAWRAMKWRFKRPLKSLDEIQWRELKQKRVLYIF